MILETLCNENLPKSCRRHHQSYNRDPEGERLREACTVVLKFVKSSMTGLKETAVGTDDRWTKIEFKEQEGMSEGSS